MKVNYCDKCTLGGKPVRMVRSYLRLQVENNSGYKQQFIPKGWFCLSCNMAIWDNQKPQMYKMQSGQTYTYSEIVKLAEGIGKKPDEFIEDFRVITV